MSRIVRADIPEEQELKKKQAELRRLETRLGQRELDLETLRAELHVFEARYLREVGSLYWKLDEIEAQIAEKLAIMHPEKVEVQKRAAEARARAQETAEAVGKARKEKHETEFKPSDELKKLYRKLAKRIHPDLANDEKERERRHEMMAAANRAYEDGDIDRLQKILSEWETSPESVIGEDLASQLERVNRKIEIIRARLDAIRIEIVEHSQSDLYKLKSKVEKADAVGKDILSEMAARVRDDIKAARKRLDQINRRTHADAQAPE